MKIGLVDVDSHNFPNIPLMKLSAYHKRNGDNVEFAKTGIRYDRLYMSKIFTESREPGGMEAEEVIRGGSGYNLRNRLPEEMRQMKKAQFMALMMDKRKQPRAMIGEYEEEGEE